MSAQEPVPFTGERLHEDALFAVDLARHRAAYRFAAARAGSGRVLDLGCGSGYGSRELAEQGARVVAVDRVPPDPRHRGSGPLFLRGDLRALPLRPASFDLVASFQVIEHLEDPEPYVRAIAGLLRPGGTAIVTTPNRLTSDGENPFHVREYTAEELAALLRPHFAEVEMLGVGATGAVARYYQARLERIRRITRLDPLGLRRRIPRPVVEWLFARLALVVRRGIRSEQGLPEASWRDFPIGPADAACLDLLAVGRAAGPARSCGPPPLASSTGPGGSGIRSG